MEEGCIRALRWERSRRGLTRQRQQEGQAGHGHRPALSQLYCVLRAGKPKCELQSFHRQDAKPGESCFFLGLSFLSRKTKVEGDEPWDPVSGGESAFSLQILYCRGVLVLGFADSALRLSLLPANLRPTTDLKNKGKQQATVFLINSANSRGKLGVACWWVIRWSWALLQSAGWWVHSGSSPGASWYLHGTNDGLATIWFSLCLLVIP